MQLKWKLTIHFGIKPCPYIVVVAIVNTQKSRLILVNMEIGCKDPYVHISQKALVEVSRWGVLR